MLKIEDDALRVRGRPGGGGDPQLSVGMAVTRDGIPIKSWIFPGDTTDVTTIETVKENLRGWRLNRCLWVTDAGMVSEANLRRLAGGGAHYVVAMPSTTVTGESRNLLQKLTIPLPPKVLAVEQETQKT